MSADMNQKESQALWGIMGSQGAGGSWCKCVLVWTVRDFDHRTGTGHPPRAAATISLIIRWQRSRVTLRDLGVIISAYSFEGNRRRPLSIAMTLPDPTTPTASNCDDVTSDREGPQVPPHRGDYLRKMCLGALFIRHLSKFRRRYGSYYRTRGLSPYRDECNLIRPWMHN